MKRSRWTAAMYGLANLSRAVRGQAPLAMYRSHDPRMPWASEMAAARLQGTRRRTQPTTLPQLRAEAQLLVSTNAIASAVPQLYQENVIGIHGILYRADVTRPGRDAQGRPSDESDEAANVALEDGWTRWAESPTVDRQTSWCELEQQQQAAEPTDGEVLARLVPGWRGNRYRFALQPLDPDQLDVSLNREPTTEGGTRIVMGVELDDWGAPVAYHLLPNHPTEYGPRGRPHLVVPAEDVIHDFHRARARFGQVRGEPWFAPVLADLHNLGKWREAYLWAARVASTKMGFITLDKDADTEDLFAPAEDGADGEDGAEVEVDQAFEMIPGIVERLRKGETFDGFDPTFPNASYGEVEAAFLRGIATTMRLSYMSLSGDLNKTSFGSGRLGLLAERLVFQGLQRKRITRWSRPVHRRWLESALLAGAIEINGRIPAVAEWERLQASTWHPRSFPWIDPERDIDALLKEVGASVNSLTRVAAESGRDFETILRERAREVRLTREANVPVSLGGGTAAPSASRAPTRPTETDAEDDEAEETDASTDDDTADDDTTARSRARVVPLRLHAQES
jgi:lambda family phage portal protein